MTKLDLAYSRSHRSRRLRQENMVSFTSWAVEVALACRRPPPPHGCSTFPSQKLRAESTDQSGGGGVSIGPLSGLRSEEHTSELQSLMRISYAVFCLKKKKRAK